MRLHHKLSLALLPAVLLAVVGFGAWAYAAAYEALSNRALQGVGWLAERFVEEQLAARYGGEVDALGRQMRQADALAAIAGLARSGPQRVVLLDAERRVLHASGPDVAERPTRWGDLLAGADAATERFEEPDGRAWLYGVQRFEPWGWSVMVLEPEDGLVAAIARIRWITAWTALLTALVVVTMVLWVSREMLARPIRTLQQAAARIARDPAPVRIAIESGDELDDLARSMEAMAAALAAEIDRREEADRQLERVKNLYAALGETNQALVRIHERSELLNALCRIAVQHGGFLLAWVGELDHATGWLVPCAVAGPAAAMVESIRVSVLGERAEGRGVTGRACRGDGWAIENDFLGNPDMAPWREAARGFGIGSAAAFGLYEEGELTGFLVVYAAEAGFFRADLVALLRSLAADISFALSALRRAEARERAEHAQRDAEERLHSALEASGDGIWELDLASGQLIATPRCLEMLGYVPGDIPTTYEAWDELLHPEDRRDTEAAIEAHVRGDCVQFVREHRLRCADGQYRWVRSAGRVMRRDADGHPLRMFGTLHDINDRKAAEERILFLGYRDVLTGLPNRVLFADRLSQALAHARRSGRRVAVMFLDLDRFKVVNDTLGHGVGDALLCAVAERLRRSVREADTVCRRGGDEFVVALQDVDEIDTVARVAGKIRDRLSEPFELDDHTVHVGASIGVALFPDDGAEPEALIRHADTAMYAAKEAGRGTVQFFMPVMDTRAERRRRLETALRRSLADGLLHLELRAQVALADGRVVRGEALLRSDEPALAGSPAADILALADECGLADPLDDWLIASACREQRRWREAGLPLLPVMVKLAAAHLRGQELPRRVAEVLVAAQMPAECLELAFAESVVTRDLDLAEANLRALRRMGVRIALDGFGSGGSSLVSLKRFPVDRLTIDASLVRDLPDDRSSAELTRAIVAMAHALQLEVVAAGVEQASQRDFLAGIGCDHAQGDGIAAVCDGDAFVAWLAAGRDAAQPGA